MGDRSLWSTLLEKSLNQVRIIDTESFSPLSLKQYFSRKMYLKDLWHLKLRRKKLWWRSCRANECVTVTSSPTHPGLQTNMCAVLSKCVCVQRMYSASPQRHHRDSTYTFVFSVNVKWSHSGLLLRAENNMAHLDGTELSLCCWDKDTVPDKWGDSEVITVISSIYSASILIVVQSDIIHCAAWTCLVCRKSDILLK